MGEQQVGGVPRARGAVMGFGVVAVAAVTVLGGALHTQGVRSAAPGAPAALPVAGCTAVVLPTLGGRGGNVVAASSNGILTGVADDSSGVSRVVVWRNGRARSLGLPLQQATPTGVNDKGVVVGTGFDPRRREMVGWWWRRGVVHVLSPGRADAAMPEAIDDRGRVVGAVDDNEDERAAVWRSVSARPRVLPSLAGDNGSHAFAIARDGTVGGVSLGSGGTPVVWTGGRVERLPALQRYGMVRGFDDRSRPVGAAYLRSGASRAVTWSAAGRPTDLGGLVAGASGAVAGTGSGVVVGSSARSVTAGPAARPQAMVWARGAGRVLAPARQAGFRGVSGTANDAIVLGRRTLVVGYSADAVGLRLPTVWRCAR